MLIPEVSVKEQKRFCQKSAEDQLIPGASHISLDTERLFYTGKKCYPHYSEREGGFQRGSTREYEVLKTRIK